MTTRECALILSGAVLVDLSAQSQSAKSVKSTGDSQEYCDVASFVYPQKLVEEQGLEPIAVVVAVDGSTAGTELFLCTNTQSLLAGPNTVFGGAGVLQAVSLSPVRVEKFPKRAPDNHVLMLKARNTGGKGVSRFGAAQIMFAKKAADVE